MAYSCGGGHDEEEKRRSADEEASRIQLRKNILNDFAEGFLQGKFRNLPQHQGLGLGSEPRGGVFWDLKLKIERF